MIRIIETVTHYETKPACKTAAEMENICCEATAALQCCVESEPVWGGYSQDEIMDHLGIALDADGRDEDGRYVNIEFAPRDHPCGEKRVTYDLSGKNCCDEVEPIVWDAEMSVEVIADNSHGAISVAGGRPPYTVSLRGTGFFLDPSRTIRDGVVASSPFYIFTGNACGACSVTITDGCSEVGGVVRSTNGRWVPTDMVPWCLSGYVEDIIGTRTAINGKYKHIQSYHPEGMKYSRSEPKLYAPPVPDDVPCTGTCPDPEAYETQHLPQCIPGVELCGELVCRKTSAWYPTDNTGAWYYLYCNYYYACVYKNEYFVWEC